MEAISNGAPTLEATPASHDDHCHQIGGDGGAAQGNEARKLSSYEQLREERIKENLVRMQQLGLFDLSLKLKSVKPPRKNNYKSSSCKNPASPLPPSEPRRRSSRLQNTPPVTYCEVSSSKKDASSKVELNFLKEGPMPEVYTDEHEKLLGSTNMSWALFVDGYGQDGKRIYDPVQGKTCHQCRQKTLGHRTCCSKCDMVQGQFCGDCLYMRYGEHVLEAKQNPNWICPVCRGICNCSLCRTAKGWAPTGALYKKISQLGFKSVAHYLIQTRRSQTDPDKTPGTNIPVSAKRSLAFSDMEPPSEEKGSPVSSDYHHGVVTHGYEEKKAADDEFKGEKWEETHFSETKHDASNIASAATQEPNKMQLNTASCDYLMALSKPESEDDKTDNMLEDEEENKHGDRMVGVESTPKSKRKSPLVPEPATYSIAGILRQSLAGNLHGNVSSYPRADDEFKGETCEETHISETEHYSNIASAVTQEPNKYDAVNTVSCDYHKALSKPEPEDDKSESKLDGKFDENKHSDNNVAEERTPKLKRKSPRLPEPAPDSIAGRLRQRRRRGNVHDEELIGGEQGDLIVKAGCTKCTMKN
ncbi:uncharacterized protein LOC127804891 [Diospyros lotus]|uniref:uncharacterized protein LOC127804891 n=1 Tax=Diospyros lotus TaxID=55363 RepID=UPI0022572DF5|nr:uncharacterized protein LOC127804891 [Diospyros lotus]